MSDAETPTDPIPADDQPHAYVLVERTHSPHADRPEWDRGAIVIPEWDHDELAHWRDYHDKYALIPIGPDGDTGTRAITEPRTVSTVEELDALPEGTVIRLRSLLLQAGWSDIDLSKRAWAGFGHHRLQSSSAVILAAKGLCDITVVDVPAEVSDGE
ncbi:hypothetical protein ACFO5K_04445 [Nocardia halotolerans]|uniref:Uncharacterized protein n=1 Tax=Nocardia halotolerans TaxID=1755878 RepID=A0ABV8VBP6_9NOCA